MVSVKETINIRYKVTGLKSLEGVSFDSEEDALKEAQIHYLMQIIYKGNIDYSVPNPAYQIASVLREELVNAKTDRFLKKLVRQA